MRRAISRFTHPVRMGLVAITVMSLAACGVSSTSSHPTVTVTATVTSSTSPDPKNSCSSSALMIGLGSQEGTAGTFYAHVLVTNVSRHACNLLQFPEISIGQSTVIQVKLASANQAEIPALLNIGKSLDISIRIPDSANFMGGNCLPLNADVLAVHMAGYVYGLQLKSSGTTITQFCSQGDGVPTVETASITK